MYMHGVLVFSKHGHLLKLIVGLISLNRELYARSPYLNLLYNLQGNSFFF